MSQPIHRPIALKATNLRKSFYDPVKVDILTGVDLTIFKGDTVAIMGRSGEGKSTLLQILGTLETPCSGTLEIDGVEVGAFNKSSIRNKKLAFIFQSFHLLDDFSALDNVLMPARIARQNVSKGSSSYDRACSLLDKMGLGDRKHFQTKLLSGGEKQRVAIARALCNDPEIILADEPSGNLDKQTAAMIHELLIQFAADENKTLIFVTHDRDLASLCQTNYTLSSGKLSIDNDLVCKDH